jgi:hypothetical protein
MRVLFFSSGFYRPSASTFFQTNFYAHARFIFHKRISSPKCESVFFFSSKLFTPMRVLFFSNGYHAQVRVHILIKQIFYAHARFIFFSNGYHAQVRGRPLIKQTSSPKRN